MIPCEAGPLPSHTLCSAAVRQTASSGVYHIRPALDLILGKHEKCLEMDSKKQTKGKFTKTNKEEPGTRGRSCTAGWGQLDPGEDHRDDSTGEESRNKHTHTQNKDETTHPGDLPVEPVNSILTYE